MSSDDVRRSVARARYRGSETSVALSSMDVGRAMPRVRGSAGLGALERINFEVAVLGEGDLLEPPPVDRIAVVRRWFRWFGVRSESTGFGVVGEATRQDLTSMFGASAEVGRVVAVPTDLEGLVSHIKIGLPSTLLGQRVGRR